MDELERRVSEVRRALGEPEWSDGQQQALRARVERSLSEKRARRGPALLAFTAVAAALAVWVGLNASRRPSVHDSAVAAVGARTAVAPRNPAVLFSDGSRADAVSSDMRVEAVTQSSARVEAHLLAGAARFDVVRNPSREFIVHAGNVNVSVLGTVFTVAHEGARVHVAVMVGRVRVDWGSGSTLLLQDGEGVFPPVMEAEAPAEAAAPERKPASKPPVANSGKQRWVELAKAGDFNAAYTRLVEAGSTGVADVPEELLLAADVSRRSGHVDQAAGHLERLLARYPRDPRAGVAAFTLGRIRLQLGRPAAAASAFELVASSGGALAEDAMYRAVMAFRQAGDAANAARMQARYLATYAGGRYVDSLQKKP